MQRLDSWCSVLGLRDMVLPTITILILLHLRCEVTLKVVVADLGHIEMSDSVIPTCSFVLLEIVFAMGLALLRGLLLSDVGSNLMVLRID